MMGLDLNSKVAGIPVPVIGGVIGLAFVGFLYFRSASSSAASAAPTTVAVPDLGPGDQIDSTGTQGGGVAADVAQFLSNGTWTASALAWEVSTNGTSPLTVQGALERYLTGEALSFDDQGIINRIIGKFGLPPQGVTGLSALLPKDKIPLKDPAAETPIPTPTGGGSSGGGSSYSDPVPSSVAVSYTQRDWGTTGAYAGTVNTTVSQSTVDRIASGNISGYTPREAAELLASAGIPQSTIKAATGWG